ncbi:hypothetical protein AMK59_8278, partial [Oryctes borbonicus]
MICLVLFLALVSSAIAGYSDSTTSNNKVGTGYGYGYSGSFSGGPGVPLAPYPQFDFSNLLQQYFESLRKYHEQIAAHIISYSATTADPHNQAQAQTSLNVPSRIGAAQASNYGGYGFPGGFPAYAGFNAQTPGAGFPGFASGFSTNVDSGHEGAAASASIGPQGIHQTAAVFPENSKIPNVDNRFG